MSFLHDARGASEILGLILAFALVMTLLTTIQLTAVPAWVSDAEATHSEALEADVVDLEAALVSAATTGAEGQAHVTLAAKQPTRMGFVTPASAAGHLSTSDPATITIDNALAIGAESSFWDGRSQSFDTRHLTVAPEYNQYDDETDYVIEAGVVYARHGNDHERIVHDVVVNGNRILLVTVDGSVDLASAGTETLAITGISVSEDPIQITSPDDDPITIRLPTTLSEKGWTKALKGEEYASLSDYETVDGVKYVTIALDPIVTYELRLAKVGVGNGWTVESPAYLVATDGNNSVVRENSAHYVTVEARDEFNNPVANAEVEVTREPGIGTVTAVDGSDTAWTNADGQATFVYVAPENQSSPDSFDVKLVDVDGEAAETTIVLEVRDTIVMSGLDGTFLMTDFGGLAILLAFASAVVAESRRRRTPRPDSFLKSRRGTSTLLALMLGVGIVVSFVVLLQTSAVPQWNAQVEFEHSQELQNDVSVIEDAIQRAATMGSEERISVDSAADYPDRPLFVNPGETVGRVELTQNATVTIENLTLVGPDGKYWNGSDQFFLTQSLLISAEYEELEDNPVAVLEGFASYREHGDVQLGTAQMLVDGDVITLVFIQGDPAVYTDDLEELAISAVSTGPSHRTVASDSPLTITLPTGLDESHWVDALPEELLVTHDGEFVTIQFQPNVSYELRIAVVGIDHEERSPEPAYLVILDGNRSVVPEGGRHYVTLAARDEFGNPAAGVRLTLDTSTLEGEVTPVGGDRTDRNGEVTYRYTAPDDIDENIVESFRVRLPVDGEERLISETVTLTVWDDDTIVVGDQNVTVNTPFTGTIQILATEDSALKGGEVEYTVINSRVVLVVDGVRDVRTPWPDYEPHDSVSGIITENINDPTYDERAPDVPWVYTTEVLPAGSSIALELTAYQTGLREQVGSILEVGGTDYQETRATSYEHMRIDIDSSDEDEENLILLVDGDEVPNAGTAGEHQWSVRDILAERIDDDNRLRLAENEIVILFELTGEATHDQLNANGGNPDYNDAVALLTIDAASPDDVDEVDEPEEEPEDEPEDEPFDIGDRDITLTDPAYVVIEILATEDSLLVGNEIEYSVITSTVVLTVDGVREERTPWPDGDANNSASDSITENINDPTYAERDPDTSWVYQTEVLPGGSTVTLELTSYWTHGREQVGTSLWIDEEGMLFHETRATSHASSPRVHIDTEDTDEENLIILGDGAMVYNDVNVAWPNQWTIEEILQERLDESNRLQLEPGETVWLFEMTRDASRADWEDNDGDPDYNDVVALITVYPVPDESDSDE